MRIPYQKMGKSYLIDSNGEKFLFPGSPMGFLTSDLFSLSEKLRILRLMLSIKRGAFNHLDDTTLKDWMVRHNIQGGIQRFFEILSASMMVCPFIEKTSTGEMFRILQRMLQLGHTIEYPANGWKPIFEALISQIEHNGSIRLQNRVDEVIFQKDQATGVVVKGKEYPADIVVINLPVQEIFNLLPEKKFSQDYVHLCKTILPTSGTFVDIAIDRSLGEYNGLLYTYNPITIGMITSNITRNVAPQGKQLITFWYPTSREDIADRESRAIKRKELMGAVHRFFPEIEKHMIWKRETSLEMVDGAQVNIHQTAKKRPSSRVPGLQNLFLVGDSIAAEGGGGDIGNESVLLTYQAITGRDLICN